MERSFKMARIESPLKKIMFVSDYSPSHYDWTPRELMALEHCESTARVLLARLKAKGIKISRMYAIEHNADTKNFFWASKRHNQEPEFKAYQETVRVNKHIHVLIFFEEDSKIERTKAAEIMGVSKYAIDKIHSEDGCLAYLCHCKYEKKFQYPKTAVYTLVGTDYEKIYDENFERWYVARENTTEYSKKRNKKAIFKEILERYKSGDITYEEIFAVEEYYEVVLEPYYKKRLDEQKNNIDTINYTNINNLEQKIEKDKLISIDCNSIGKPLYTAYLSDKANIDNRLCKILLEKVKNEEISLKEILSNEHYYSLAQKLIYDFSKELSSQLFSMIETGEITTIDEINNNKLLSKIYNNHQTTINELLSQKT